MPLKTEKFASVMQGHRFSNLTPRPPSAKNPVTKVSHIHAVLKH